MSRYHQYQKLNHRKFGRCTAMGQVCPHWNELNGTKCFTDESQAS